MVQKVAVEQKKIENVEEIVGIALPSELANHPLLQGVSQQSLTKLANKFDVVRVPRSANIYQIGAIADTLYLVAQGVVRTLHKNDLGETFESDWRQGFTTLGLTELLTQAPQMLESTVAAESIVAYAIPMSLVRELMTRDIALLGNIARALADRQSQAIRNERAILDSAFVRVANYLTTLSNREGNMVSPDLYLVRTTQDDIAGATGLNPRTVSRAMKALQQKGRLYIRRGEYLLREPLSLAKAFDGDVESSAKAVNDAA